VLSVTSAGSKDCSGTADGYRLDSEPARAFLGASSGFRNDSYPRSHASGDSPSQHPSLKRQRGHCQVPCRHSIAALQRRQRSVGGAAVVGSLTP
jgi:hypothetical protein